ncbi:hypothetical protein EDD16DRAFT_1526645 [Pisolithus croceorrhizus]|nr:hypothetical protein EDD16DRAFT_1526645 [Pisolithus croceorrhizus]KAI6124951.1 hypothetical protein EV401DRAFT_1886109 [Pisolithus croceorrhizus]
MCCMSARASGQGWSRAEKGQWQEGKAHKGWMVGGGMGQITLDLQIQRCTSEQKQADNEALQQAKEVQLDALQKSYEHVSMMESTMATRQMQDGTRQEKPIRPKLQPWSAGQSMGGVEEETKLNAAKEIDEEQSEIGLKARERTILKLRRAIEQVCKQVSMEAELGTAKDINHKQPRGDKTVSKQKGMMKQGGVPMSTAVLSAHMNSGMCEKNAASKCVL